jgi:hypothetical protein
LIRTDEPESFNPPENLKVDASDLEMRARAPPEARSLLLSG